MAAAKWLEYYRLLDAPLPRQAREERVALRRMSD
jgi:hypothetical protein